MINNYSDDFTKVSTDDEEIDEFQSKKMEVSMNLKNDLKVLKSEKEFKAQPIALEAQIATLVTEELITSSITEDSITILEAGNSIAENR